MSQGRNERIIDVVTGLGEAFGRAVTKATVNAYAMALADLTIEAIEQAAIRAMRELKFFPTVAELRDLAGGVRQADRATLAWEAVMSAQLNPYRHVDFDCPLINATIRNLGGWPAFIERFSDAESEKWVRKDFMDCYSRLLSSGVNGDSCRPLAGLSECSIVNGQRVPPIVHRLTTGLPAIAQEKIRPAISAGLAMAMPTLELKRPPQEDDAA